MASYGADHLGGFFTELARDSTPGTTTRLRCLKRIYRFTRRLVNLEMRGDKPAAQMLVNENWRDDESTPVYLSAEDDARLKAVCVRSEGAPFTERRNIAIVALFHSSGVTADDLRELVDDLDVSSDRLTVFVDKHGPRIARRVLIDAFDVDVLRDHHDARRSIQCATLWLFVATSGGKPMQSDTMLKCVRTALKRATSA